jgi:hypothetical protein
MRTSITNPLLLSPQDFDTSQVVASRRRRFEWLMPGGPFALSPAEMAFETLMAYPRSLVSFRPQVFSTANALDGREGEIYSEEAFQHFLSVERRRSRRLESPFMLLLVSLRRCSRSGVEFPRAVSPILFSGLGLCIREVDFTGWYREGRVAGAVLAQGIELPDADAKARIVARVTRTLEERLPRPIAQRLRVRVVQLGRRA